MSHLILVSYIGIYKKKSLKFVCESCDCVKQRIYLIEFRTPNIQQQQRNKSLYCESFYTKVLDGSSLINVKVQVCTIRISLKFH